MIKAKKVMTFNFLNIISLYLYTILPFPNLKMYFGICIRISITNVYFEFLDIFS